MACLQAVISGFFTGFCLGSLTGRRFSYFYPFALLLLCSLPGRGQDVEAIANRLGGIKQERLNITGSVRLNSQHYWANGLMPRRDNWQWGVQANLNFSFLGFSAPFSLAFSDANTNYRLPSYTFLGISPRYKWATLHLGDRNLNFSRYTMSGISFRGAGFTLEPGKWQVSSFYGRLNRALANDLGALGNLNDYYSRIGYGLRFGFNDQKNSYHLNFFGADDQEDAQAIDLQGVALPLSTNRVTSFELRRQLTRRFTLAGEIAQSAFSNDQNAPQLSAADYRFGNRLLGWFTPNESTQSGTAYNASLNYTASSYGLQARYERIERGYRTLGALFFNSDTEHLTFGANRNLLENRLIISANLGIERTNLDELEAETTDRFIGAANVNYQPDEDWLFSGGYSNFRNDTKLRTRSDFTEPIDSIFLAQVNQSVNLMGLRRLGTEQRPATLQLVVNYQQANSIIEDEVATDQNNRFTAAALNYSFGQLDAGAQWSAGLAYNRTRLGDITTSAISPTIAYNRNFFDNALAASVRTVWSLFQQGGDNNQVLNLSFGGTYRLQNSHSISLRATHLNRFGSAEATRNFSEWYGGVNYGYRFGGSIGKARTATK